MNIGINVDVEVEQNKFDVKVDEQPVPVVDVAEV